MITIELKTHLPCRDGELIMSRYLELEELPRIGTQLCVDGATWRVIEVYLEDHDDGRHWMVEADPPEDLACGGDLDVAVSSGCCTIRNHGLWPPACRCGRCKSSWPSSPGTTYAVGREIKYFVSNGPANVTLEELLQAAFARWHVEKWFERSKQEVGLGAFEVRTYRSLIRHWLCCRLAMCFLAAATRRLRWERSEDYAGAGGRSSQDARREDLEAVLALVDGVSETMRVLSTA